MSGDTLKKRHSGRPAARPDGRGSKAAAERATARPSRETREEDTGGSFGPPHLFLAVSLVAAAGGAVATGGASPVSTVFVTLAIGAVGFAAFLLYRAVFPLVASSVAAGPDMVGGRTRAALEREKTTLLRSIKELEFDRAMGKVSEGDFRDMSDRLRARAVRLIKQLDTGRAGYRELIERELTARRTAIESRLTAAGQVVSAQAPVEPAEEPAEPAPTIAPTCGRCGTINDSDAQFCKQCGNKLIDQL